MGVGPLPIENPDRLYAPGLRMWIFAKVLSDHNLYILQTNFEDTSALNFHDISKPDLIKDNIKRFLAPANFSSTPKYVKDICDKYSINCIVSSTDVMNKIASLSQTNIPKWFAFFGHPMAEAQMISIIHKNNNQLLEEWLNIKLSLMTGDHFSGCSHAQKHAMIGELGICGRLNYQNAFHDLVSVIRPSFAFPDFKHTKDVIKGKLCPKDAFIVLWTGGYNTWADVDTLFDALCIAMKKDDNIYYVSTGGEIKGHNTKTFDHFKALIDKCEFKNRFIFSGWVPTEDVANYYLEGDVAINIDLFSYEGLLGARNRIIEWIQAGLPVISTDLCELTNELHKAELIHTFPIGNAAELSEKIIFIRNNKSIMSVKAQRARDYIMEEYSLEKTHKDLIEWAKNPQFAPDNMSKDKDNPLYEHMLNTNQSAEIIKGLNEKNNNLEIELNKMNGKKIFKIYNFVKKFF